MKILVGYDGSVYADGVLYDLLSAGMPSDSEALVLSVAMPWMPYGLGGEAFLDGWGAQAIPLAEEHAGQALEKAREDAERAARYLREHFPGWRVQAEAMLDLPAQGLLQKADAWRPDLIAVGSHGRTGLMKLLLGGISQRILHHARASVRIARPRVGAKTPAPKLVVGVDGSRAADAAVDQVASRSWPIGTEVRLVAAVDPRLNPEIILEETPAPDAGVPKRSRAGRGRRKTTWLEAKAEGATARLRAAGLTATPVIRWGEPRQVILREAAKWPSDGIFLGSRGLNAVERIFLGSVSSAVAEHAPCSVEVVRSDRPGADRAALTAAYRPGTS